MMSYCDCWMLDVRLLSSVINNLKNISSTTSWILTNFGRNDPFMALFKMVSFHCISRSHRLNIDFQDEYLNIFSETTRPRALIFSL